MPSASKRALSPIYIDLCHTEQRYDISRRKTWDLIRTGRLKAFKVDGKTLVRVADLERLITASPITAAVDLNAIADEAVAAVLGVSK